MNNSPKFIISFLNKMNKNTLMETLSIKFIYVNSEILIAKMPINSKVHQSYGLLHGGASVVLAETVGSSISAIHLDLEKYQVLGMQISANHLKSIKKGFLYAKASFLKKGCSTHLVQIKLYDEKNESICLSLLTNFIKKNK